jgi:hypothetical protein
MQTDSSNVGLGAFLHQLEGDGRLRVITFARCILKRPECNYYATELEACMGFRKMARLACRHDQNSLQRPHLLTQLSPSKRPFYTDGPCFSNRLLSKLNTVRVRQTLSLMPLSINPYDLDPNSENWPSNIIVAALNWKGFDKELLKKLKHINNEQKAEAELALII